MSQNNMDISKEKKNTKESNGKTSNHIELEDNMKSCPMETSNVECSSLNYPCIVCNTSNANCRYGSPHTYECNVTSNIQCTGARKFNRTAMCRYCYQTEKWEHRCDQKANCNSLASPLKYYPTNCTVLDDVICLGRRRFIKKIKCSWTAGTRWGTALILALTLGGFGADRFYLGHWQEGIGKLFSFGGLGVWTLVDALLIGIHHLGPADGSLYI
ncbi:TM2 domain-containing protein [Phthorimaea operculella]|nr:TM2 domain-containing protein [Phthorimaea operculella]